MKSYRVTEAVGETYGPFMATSPIDALNIVAQKNGHESHEARCNYYSHVTGTIFEPSAWTTDPATFAAGKHDALVEEVKP